jgi:uncharacterized membrane protein YqjE
VSTSPSYQSEFRQSEYRVDDGQDGQPISSVGQLMGEISADISTLMRQEVALAKTELAESASKAAKGGGMLGGAAVAGHMVLVFVSVAIWWFIGDGIGRGWSALIVAAVWLIIAAVLAIVGRSQLKAVGGLPKTSATAKKIPNALKGNEDGQ